MTSNYHEIHSENERRYGTDIGRIGPMLLTNRYDDRTHFIFELLQNAEDALARRNGWDGEKSISFLLSDGNLKISHYGEPFSEPDVRGICGIDESTKELTDIGTFGIGFKSVYAFTDRPEVHSGEEDFAIENFVWPVSASSVRRKTDETIIILPLKKDDEDAAEEITIALKLLGARTLLFLRHLQEISWRVRQGPSGLYMRTEPEKLDDGIRKLTLIGQEEDEDDTEESWLVFSREAKDSNGALAGHVELAFLTSTDEETGTTKLVPVGESRLIAYFPTMVETHMGFLMQGPYRTTPSRDNIPRRDEWNRHLIAETADLLCEALRWLRDRRWLNVTVLETLPLDQEKFDEAHLFRPMFEATREALLTEPLLPRFKGEYVSGNNAKLARGRDLLDLFTPNQLAELFESEGEVCWLTEEITQDRSPEVRSYLIQELDIQEFTAESIVPRLDEQFLVHQSDEWIQKLYVFLADRPALQKILSSIPLVRLEDESHTVALAHGKPQAFLPSTVKTEFATVRSSVCNSDEALEFLRSLGLTEPNAVDDIVLNVLPRYEADELSLEEGEYASDIGRILAAFKTDSTSQREKLAQALQEVAFVMSVDCGTGEKFLAKPRETYVATERLSALFSGVSGVLIVDSEYECLRGESIRDLLEACGATRYLQPVAMAPDFDWQERREMRIKAGCNDWSYDVETLDYSLRGLDELLGSISSFDQEVRISKAAFLWQSLRDLHERRGGGVFQGTYEWFYYRSRSTSFPAYFIRELNKREWIPLEDRELHRPEVLGFDALDWPKDHFLLDRITFKPAAIDNLAQEAGIEPEVLEFLKRYGLTNIDELKSHLDIEDISPSDKTGDETNSPPPDDDEAGDDETEHDNNNDETHGSHGPVGRGNGTGGGAGTGSPSGTKHSGSTGGKRKPAANSGRDNFISYVAVANADEDPDPDGLTSEKRMALEEKAISFILDDEPELERTSTGNPGYDLFEADESDRKVRLVEVKSMTGEFIDRPVGLTKTQFKCAQMYGESFWLYVVERANDDKPRIVKIQDPAGKARTFTFDQGWSNVAKVDSEPN